MKNLTHEDLLDVLAALEILHGETDPSTLPGRALGAVLSLIPNEITLFDGFGADSHYSGYLWYSPAGTVSEESVRILGELVRNHPIFRTLFLNAPRKRRRFCSI